MERTFVFADLAGYTAMTEAHGDENAAQVATRFHDLARATLVEGARLVKTIGDAVMLVTTTPSDAVETALALSRAVHAHRHFPAVRIGIHAGPVVERERDFFGATVNVAARVCALACRSEILCTEAIAEVAVARGLTGARPLGTMRLKNVSTPVALFALTTDLIEHELRHLDPVCRMQVTADNAAAHVDHDGTTVHFCSAGCAEKFRACPDDFVKAADV